ncbi:phenylalanyl-tRNA synthetase [Ramicandelaber brevisporus]|nr:phenylalanyl-tRNA synthetase [Ramicandelaber brevisporus]
MPAIHIDKVELYERLGRTFTTSEFTELCFEFGIELEEESTDSATGRVSLKIDIPANRYDLLCIEGLSRAVNAFLERPGSRPTYKFVDPAAGSQSRQRIVVTQNTQQVRPVLVGAVLRNIKFTPESYASFIDLQDKLHNNLCRKRRLASIGTHDLDKVVGPFKYDARQPEAIRFVPLTQTAEMNGREIMTFYEDKYLKPYLPIIRDEPLYPVVLDSSENVLSLPPIINGDLSKITLDTRNVLIELTATDKTKADVVINTLVTMYSEHCAEPFTVEQIEIVYPDGHVELSPSLEQRVFEPNVHDIVSVVGADMSAEEVVRQLGRMGHDAAIKAGTDSKVLTVRVPPTRSDILHSCDLVEDVAIAYGYNRIPKVFPAVSTIGAPFPLNKLSDRVRHILALSGYTEVLPLTLCSHDENFAYLRHEDPGNEAVALANPMTLEFQVVRTTLVPGLLKTLYHNRRHPVPHQLFEVGDVVLQDPTYENNVRNERRLCAAYSNRDSSGLEHVHGMLDQVMRMLGVDWVPEGGSIVTSNSTYTIAESQDKMFLDGRGADVFFIPAAAHIHPSSKDRVQAGKKIKIGNFGIIHPNAIKSFKLEYPVSILELNIEPLL